MELRVVPAGAPRSTCNFSSFSITRRTKSLPRRRIHLPCSHRSRSECAASLISPILDEESASSSRCFLRSSSCQRRPMRSIPRAIEEEGASATGVSEDPSEEGTGGGTVLGAASLIIGTSIGSGILALPKETSPAGFIPSTVSIIVCWAFLVVEALLVAEINVSLAQTRKKEREMNMRERKGRIIRYEEEEVASPVISFKTMAQETLGQIGGNLASVMYVFLGYTSLIAYASESGELLSQFIDLPSSSLSIFFTGILTSLISLSGTRTTSRLNEWLTALMLGLLVIVEVTAASSEDWFGLMATEDWRKVPRAVPFIIFALVYHDILPVICSYLDGDLRRIRSSIFIGSLIPLLFLLVWDGIVLGYSSQINGVDPLELLFRGGNMAESTMTEMFSILAVGTSLIGTFLGFYTFFQEQLYFLFRSNLQPSSQLRCIQEDDMPEPIGDVEQHKIHLKWLHWESIVNFSAFVVAVIPPLLISVSLADAFSVATDIAGGYCMIVLYGVMPPAMAWSLHMKQRGLSLDGLGNSPDYHNAAKNEENIGREVFGSETRGRILQMKPALVSAGLFATVLVAEQLFQDIPSLFNF